MIHIIAFRSPNSPAVCGKSALQVARDKEVFRKELNEETCPECIEKQAKLDGRYQKAFGEF